MKKKIFIFIIIFLLSFLVVSVIEGEKGNVVNKNFVQSSIDQAISDPRSSNGENKVELATSSEVLAVPEKPVITEPLPEEKSEFPEKKKNILLTVPFVAQAPYGEWSEARFQDGCEETSALLAMSWVKGEKEISKDEAKKEILAIADFEKEKYGTYRDTSASDTIARILVNYFDYQAAELKKDISIQDMIAELEAGNLLIVPCDGQKLKNPYFTAPGPDRHMLVIIGYDYDTKEFITNDPGTRQGKSYRYAEDVLYAALRNYPTGEHLPIVGEEKVMIIIKKD